MFPRCWEVEILIERSEYEWKVIADFLSETNQDLRNALVIARSENRRLQEEHVKLWERIEKAEKRMAMWRDHVMDSEPGEPGDAS